MGKPSKKQILEAIEGTGGIILTVAKKLGVHWNTAEKYCLMYEETRTALNNEKEKILDLAEIGIYKKIQEGDTDIGKWVLSRKGKNRGWSERQEITGKDGGKLEVNATIEIIGNKPESEDDPGI